MAANYPPYMNATGLISKILEKIKVAATPERFTQDYLSTELGFTGGSAKAFISLAKRIGLLLTDGTPSDLYKQFRNPKTSKAAMAKAIKKGYSDIFSRNEFAQSLSSSDLEGLIIELTGTEKGNRTVSAVVKSFEALKGYAHFGKKIPADTQEPTDDKNIPNNNEKPPAIDEDMKFNLSYTINLVLPKTDDVAVFNAIFKSLKENLLRK